MCFPIKTVCITTKDKNCPYITAGLKTSIKEKKRLERLSVLFYQHLVRFLKKTLSCCLTNFLEQNNIITELSAWI